MSHMGQFPSFPILTVFLLFLFVLIKFKKKPKVLTDKLPPGPPKLPLIGNLHQLIVGSSLPHRALANLAKKYGPVMHLQLGQQPAIIISSSEAVKEVLKTNDLNFSQRPKVLAVELMNPDNSGFAFAPYGDYWRHVRKVCVMELLSMNRVQSFKSIREEEVWDLIESICSQEGVPINLRDKIFTMINNVTSRAAFGKKGKDQGEFISVIKEAVEVVAGFNIADLFPSFKFLCYITGLQPKLKKLQRKTDKIFDDIVKEHKVKSKSTVSIYVDLLDVLLRLQDLNELDMQLTSDHIKSLIREIFIAGTDTAATTIEWAMSELIKNPGEMEKVQTELRQVLRGKTKIEEVDIQKVDCLKLIIQETLRLHPATPLLPRESMEKCEIGEYQIPGKTKILINAWAIGRDSTVWTEPDYFKPERFEDSPTDFRGTNFGFIPFGAGRRMCPGISFANANMELALAQLLYHFDWKVPNCIKPEELDMSETFGVTVGRKHSLHLIATTSIPFRV